MIESTTWLATGSELTHRVQTPHVVIPLVCRFLRHGDLSRVTSEKWFHPETVVGRLFFPFDSFPRFRSKQRWHLTRPDSFLLLPPGMSFQADYPPGRLVCHHFVVSDGTPLPIWPGTGEPSHLCNPALAQAHRIALQTPIPGILDVSAFSVLLHFLNKRWEFLALRQQLWARFNPVAQMMEKLPPAEWRVEIVARQMNCSPAALSRRFERSLGLPLKRYLKKALIARAQLALAETTDTVATVAEGLGFEDPAYFNRLFRSATGLTPLSWRRKASSVVSQKYVA